ncbi:MAG: endopeptidase La, partial [Dehalococcoidia bacterium]
MPFNKERQAMVVKNQRESRRETKLPIPEELPILPAGENILFPFIIVPLATQEQKVVQLIDAAIAENKIIGIFAQRAEQPPPDNLYSIGSAALIARMFKLPDGSIQAFLQGLARIRLKEITQTEPYLKARVEVIEEKVEKTTELEALTRNLQNLFQRVVEIAPNLPTELGIAAMNMPGPGDLADFVAAHINLKREEGQEILETLDVTERIKKLTSYINRELEILELGSKIQAEIKGEMDKAQREFFRREELKAI